MEMYVLPSLHISVSLCHGWSLCKHSSPEVHKQIIEPAVKPVGVGGPQILINTETDIQQRSLGTESDNGDESNRHVGINLYFL